MAKFVTGLFKKRAAAEAAVRKLGDWGYQPEDVSVLMSASTRSREFGIETSTQAAEGAGVGGAIGGTVGAVLAAVAAVGTTIALPGFGLVIAGPLAAALAGAGAGGLAGGLVGALIGAGIPEHRARLYEAGIQGGGILLGVEAKSDEDADKLQELFGNLGAGQVTQE